MLRKYALSIIVGWFAFILAACGSSCPPEIVTYLDPPYAPEDSGILPQSTVMEIKGKEILFDEIITGPVCNDTWRGTIYVTCEIQIPSWEKDPFFFQDCELEIEDDAVVYVEAHRNKAYDKGCSCHE
jgi:hypothetical protein